MRYAEDLAVGTVFGLGERQLTEEEIIAFAAAWDPQPFHVDTVAPERGTFGGLIARLLPPPGAGPIPRPTARHGRRATPRAGRSRTRCQ